MYVESNNYTEDLRSGAKLTLNLQAPHLGLMGAAGYYPPRDWLYEPRSLDDHKINMNLY